MSIAPEQLWGAAVIGSMVGSSLFWAVLWLGRMTARLERTEIRLDDHEKALQKLRVRRHDDE